MKPALVFVALVTIGMIVLLQLQKQFEPVLPDTTAEAAEPARERRELPAEPLVLGGEFTHAKHSEHFDVHAADSTTLAGGETIFYEFRAAIDNPETGEVRALIDAAESSIHLHTERMTQLTAIQDTVVSEEMELREVTMSLLEGGAVAPLELSVPTLSGNLRERAFESTDPATARGVGLFAEGRGIFVDVDDGIVRFDDDALLELTDGQRGTGRIRGKRSLHLLPGSKQLGGGFEAVARGGAALEWEGGHRVEVTADRIQVQARESGAGLRLDSLVATGGVSVTTPLGTFESGRAEVTQTEDLTGFEVSLFEDPRARVALTRRGQVFPADIAGAGPLTVHMSAEDTFELGGPATVRWPEGELTSQGGLRGWTTDERRGLVLSGWNGVALDATEAELETDAIELAFTQGEDGSVVRVTTDGSSRFAGVTPAGDSFEMEASERLLYEQVGERWTLPVATGVRLEVASVPPSSVAAERVSDFDPIAGTFSAEGGVVLQHGDSTARAEGIRALAFDHFVAVGEPETPAEVLRPDGFVSAQRVELRPGHLAAEGAARGEFARESFSLRADAESLVVQESATDVEGESRFDLVAAGTAQLSVVEQGNDYEVDAGSIHVDQVLAGEELRSLRLEAAREVFLRSRLLEESYSLRCQTLDVSSSPEEGGELGWTVDARGSVEVEGRSTAPFHGVSEHFLLRPDKTLEVAGEAGSRVRFEGLLPGHIYPYVLEAPSAVIAPDRLEAENPEIWLRNFDPLNTGAEGSGELYARADSLTCGLDELSLTGDARLQGVDEREIPWTLLATYVRFSGSAAGSGPPQFGSMEAWAGFQLEFGENLLADGQRLEANTSAGLLRITGSPAYVDYGLHRYESEFLEYDLYLRIIVRAAQGTLRPRSEP